jgi:hypothetical protein
MGDAPNLWNPFGFNSPYAELNRLVEALTNLMYLIQHDADDSAKVQHYVGYAEQVLERARVIVHEQMRGYSPN